MLKNPNMKMFYGTPKPIPLGQSADCPKIEASDLDGNKISIPADLPSDRPALLCVTLKPFFGQQFTGYKLLAPILKRSRRNKSIGITESWSNQAIHLRDVNRIHQALTISNPLGAYFYLVIDGKIRWKSSGKATPEELDYLLKAAQTLRDTPNPLLANRKQNN
eukprot:gene378-444_t